MELGIQLGVLRSDFDQHDHALSAASSVDELKSPMSFTAGEDGLAEVLRQNSELWILKQPACVLAF